MECPDHENGFGLGSWSREQLVLVVEMEGEVEMFLVPWQGRAYLHIILHVSNKWVLPVMLPILKQKKLLSIFIHVDGGLQLKAASSNRCLCLLRSTVSFRTPWGNKFKDDLILHQDESNLWLKLIWGKHIRWQVWKVSTFWCFKILNEHFRNSASVFVVSPPSNFIMFHYLLKLLNN